LGATSPLPSTAAANLRPERPTQGHL
jgi:hypothetical protein